MFGFMKKYVVKPALIAGSVGITFWDIFAYAAPVDGSSMQPLINPNNDTDEYNDILLLWRIPIKFNRLNRGDVVTLVSPKNPDQVLVKRLIGLPGDVIKTISYKNKYVRVPPGHCWIEGDNHEKSYDSNSFGVVPIGLIVAKASYVIWPMERLSKINTEIPSNRLLHPLNINVNNNYEFENENRIYNNNIGIEHLILKNKNVNSNDQLSSLDDKNKPKLNYYVDFVSN